MRAHRWRGQSLHDGSAEVARQQRPIGLGDRRIMDRAAGPHAERQDPVWIAAVQSCKPVSELKQKYRRGQKLGTGTFSKVYWAAKHDRAPTESPAVFALKYCQAKESDDCETIATEFHVHRAVNTHPNILTLHDAFVFRPSAVYRSRGLPLSWSWGCTTCEHIWIVSVV